MVLYPAEGRNTRRGSDAAKPAAGIGLILLLLGGGGYVIRNWWNGHQIRSQTTQVVELIVRQEFEKARNAIDEASREGKVPAKTLEALRTQYATLFDAHKKATRRDCLYDPTYPDQKITAEAIPDPKQPAQLTRPEPFKAPTYYGVLLDKDLTLYEFSRVKKAGSAPQKDSFATLRVMDKNRQTIYKTDERECSLVEITAFTGIQPIRFGPEDKDVLDAGRQRYSEITSKLYEFQNRAAITSAAEKERQKQAIAAELFGVGKQ